MKTRIMLKCLFTNAENLLLRRNKIFVLAESPHAGESLNKKNNKDSDLGHYYKKLLLDCISENKS